MIALYKTRARARVCVCVCVCVCVLDTARKSQCKVITLIYLVGKGLFIISCYSKGVVVKLYGIYKTKQISFH